MATTAQAVKVTVNLPEDLAAELKALAKKQHKTFTQALKEAIALKLFVEGELEKKSTVLIRQQDGTTREVTFGL